METIKEADIGIQCFKIVSFSVKEVQVLRGFFQLSKPKKYLPLYFGKCSENLIFKPWVPLCVKNLKKSTETYGLR